MSGEETTDLYALSGQVSEDAGDETLEGRHNGVIKHDALADEHGNHLVGDIAFLDRLEEPNRIALTIVLDERVAAVSTKQSTQWPSPLRVPITKPYGKGCMGASARAPHRQVNPVRRHSLAIRQIDPI